MKCLITVFKVSIVALIITGCTAKVSWFDLKPTVGRTEYEDGRSNIYTGCSVTIHYEVK